MSQWCRLFWRTSYWLWGARICGTEMIGVEFILIIHHLKSIWWFQSLQILGREMMWNLLNSSWSSQIHLMISDWNCAISLTHAVSRLWRHPTWLIRDEWRKGCRSSLSAIKLTQSTRCPIRTANLIFEQGRLFMTASAKTESGGGFLHSLDSSVMFIVLLNTSKRSLMTCFKHVLASSQRWNPWLAGSWAVGKPGRAVPPPVALVSETDRGGACDWHSRRMTSHEFFGTSVVSFEKIWPFQNFSNKKNGGPW